ncbi:MAG: cytochrome c [Caldilineaceae bacterium]|nr:cytochrome c [Caldilineaceae bacterium]
MMLHRTHTNWSRLLPVILFVFLLTACGGAQDEQSSASAPRATDAPVPTMPAARFTAVAQQVYTDTASSDAAATSAPAPTPTEGVDLTRGKTIYDRRCAECHGPEGEGVADKGNALTGMTLDATAFGDVVRTAKSGELGTEHIFGPSAVSPSGLDVLFAFVQSLSE